MLWIFVRTTSARSVPMFKDSGTLPYYGKALDLKGRDSSVMSFSNTLYPYWSVFVPTLVDLPKLSARAFDCIWCWLHHLLRSFLYGVPQGSILGPLLFLMFINDLPLFTHNVKTDMYADDTTLFDINVSKDIIQANLQKALRQLDIWCKHNGMLINTSKTKVMLNTTTQKWSKLTNDTLNLFYKDVSLQMISYIKF